MPLRSNCIIAHVIIWTIFSLNFVITVGAVGPIIDDPIVVLFDEGHGQYYNRSLYSQAISDLRVNKSMIVVFNTGEFNTTSFEGVDILVSTNPQIKVTNEESKYVYRFITQGKGMLFLANPLNEDNGTLNGRGDILNDFLGKLKYGDRMGLFWTYSETVEDSKPGDTVINDFSYAGEPNYLHLNLNTSSHEILYIDKNITSIVTYSCSIEKTGHPVLAASSEAYSRTISGKPGSTALVEGSLILMGASMDEVETGARVVIGGSSMMFSDLNGPFGTSWYKTENNSYLWWNIFDWLAEATTDTSTQPPLSPEVLFQIFLLLVGISTIFLLGGSLSYSIGSGKKISLVKLGQEVGTSIKETIEEVKESSTVQQGPPSRESRRDRRFRQIKKHHKQRK